MDLRFDRDSDMFQEFFVQLGVGEATCSQIAKTPPDWSRMKNLGVERAFAFV